MGVRSISVSSKLWWLLFSKANDGGGLVWRFLRLCRNINIIKMPKRRSMAMAPITAPAMRPGEGPVLFEDEGAGSWEAVDCAADCEVAGVVEKRVVCVAALLLDAFDAAGLVCDVVRADGVAGKLGRAVGMTMSLLDRKVATMPPTLCRILPICLRSWWYLRSTMAAPMLPAAWQALCIAVSALARPACKDGIEAWLSWHLCASQ
jgi:hypothetical protein